MRRLILAGLLALALPGAAFAHAGPPISIYADSGPVAVFASRIAGPAAIVTLPVPEDRDPAFWRPSIATIAAVQKADLIVLNGAGLAAWTARTTLPRARTVETAAAFRDLWIETEGVTHSHGAEGAHTHTAIASFTWLDFDLAARQARAIADALVKAMPEAKGDILFRYGQLESDLQMLDQTAAALGRALGGRAVIASHPRYQYFARAYGLAVEAVSWDPATPPAAGELAALDALLARHPAELMIFEAAPGAEAMAALERRGLRPVVFETGAQLRPEGDFVRLMRENLARLAAAAGV